MGRNTVAELGYVGLVGRRRLGETDIHQPSLAARQASAKDNAVAVVPYTGHNRFAARVPDCMSNYNALQASLNHRTVHGLTLEMAYTWSTDMTNESNDRGTAIYDIYNPAKDDGPASLNRPQAFLADGVYQLPFFRTQYGLAGYARGGWEVSGLVSAHNGFSPTVRQEPDNVDCVMDAGAANGCVAGTYPGGLNTGLHMGPGDIASRLDRVGPSRACCLGLTRVTSRMRPSGMACLRNRTVFISGASFSRPLSRELHLNWSQRDQAVFGRVTAAGDPRQIPDGRQLLFLTICPQHAMTEAASSD